MSDLTPDQIDETAQAIAAWQLPSGMIPWFPGGHADPWNHVEAAMALGVAGRTAEAERAYEWLRSLQLPDGSWHQYYDAQGVVQDKFDANVIAYVATGVWHHFLLTRDRGFADAMWPMVDRAMDFVFQLQQERGEILWARHSDGTPWSFALLTGSSSMFHSTRAALAIARELDIDREHWSDRIERLGRVVRERPDGAFAPKNRWAMDWYYPVLTGAITGVDALTHLVERHDVFTMPGLGVRCVGDRPWVTTGETSECAIAYLAAGDPTMAAALFATTHALRSADGHYWTGEVHPERVHFPAEERTTYSSAAVLLADDALTGRTAASHLFVDHDLLPA
ncbi:MAG: prenyltransferase [Acidimicrobiales bacterium]